VIERNLRFRGPDGSSGLIKQNGWASYHSRLSIIDLTEGTNQPVINKDCSQLVFNGEILNYQELGHKYFNKNYSSDTFLLNDLIVNDLLNLNELDGFFAFVFIDDRGELKYACRDKFGVKPLFYYKHDDQIAFSSEPNVLKDLFDLAVNKLALQEYRAFRAPIFQGSFFQGVEQIGPGCCYKNGQYFSIEDELLTQKVDESSNLLNDVEAALEEGVSSRCVSDVPIGLLLSKGIDSNLIRFTGHFQRLYSVGFSGDEDIEYLAKAKVPNLTILRIQKEQFRKAFAHLLTLRKEPMSVPNEVMLYLIACEAKRDGVKVLLSGEGADEFFGGYDRVFTWAKNAEFFDLDVFLSLYAYDEVSQESQLYYRLKHLFSECHITEPFEIVRWFFMRFHMPVLFRRLDFALMAAGVEGREPIANCHLFDICKNLTSSLLMSEGLGKKPLRDLLARHMGNGFAFEKKVGFPVDLTEIFDNPKGLSSYDLWFERNLEILA